jgi:hypothetical protein
VVEGCRRGEATAGLAPRRREQSGITAACDSRRVLIVYRWCFCAVKAARGVASLCQMRMIAVARAVNALRRVCDVLVARMACAGRSPC